MRAVHEGGGFDMEMPSEKVYWIRVSRFLISFVVDGFRMAGGDRKCTNSR